MANWHGSARTNYVKVKDYDALVKFLDGIPVEVHPHPNAENFVMFQPTDNDSGDFSYQYLDDDGDEMYWSWQEAVCPHLVEGQVLILMTVGSEKLRYLTGYAEAYAWDGRNVGININEIYCRAAQMFNVPIATIALCTYMNLPDEMPKEQA